jgi:hypothetical protein
LRTQRDAFALIVIGFVQRIAGGLVKALFKWGAQSH